MIGGPILVTGAAGFAGSHVVEALAGNAETVGWMHRASPPAEIASFATWQQVDLLNAAEVREASPEIVHALCPPAAEAAAPVVPEPRLQRAAASHWYMQSAVQVLRQRV